MNRGKMANIFIKYFIKAYEKLGKSKTFGIQKIFIPITQIRHKVYTQMNITEEQFNHHLKFLADNDIVNLHGAPTDAYSRVKNPFEYEGKLYLYVSMR